MNTVRLEDYDDMQDLIDGLQGTCQSLDTEGMTPADLEMLDEQIFECSACGWWMEVGQEIDSESGERVCDECGCSQCNELEEYCTCNEEE